ncbi:DOPA 4,5-dioxygenase family protein [Veronia pacifica]|uniref:4,5-dioxygenase n=1 Tax=Veronia pacifica TaxID=1080227 RepID=A0A1C3ESM5_9GAMM|nr:DOPA 4,5-dioxygenase family protein [Veronia pacifica]ODA36231.1 4,5-dioxygenase [Veronia pacifica]
MQLNENRQYPQNLHHHYHAHVYFDSSSAAFAQQLRESIHHQLGVEIGRFHRKKVGPHTMWSYQILFQKNNFDTVVNWLELQRKHLSILIHGVTGDDYLDHTDNAYWLGESVELDLSAFTASPKMT